MCVEPEASPRKTFTQLRVFVGNYQNDEDIRCSVHLFAIRTILHTVERFPSILIGIIVGVNLTVSEANMSVQIGVSLVDFVTMEQWEIYIVDGADVWNASRV